MNHLTSNALQRLRNLINFLGKPFRSDLALLLNERGNELPTVAEEPTAIDYHLVLDDLAARLRVGTTAAELLEMIACATSEDAVRLVAAGQHSASIVALISKLRRLCWLSCGASYSH